MTSAAPPPGDRRLSLFGWGVLAFTLAVVAWGAFVRATGSGAGCGNHWPLCNGEALPRPERLETLIELTHRLTSAVDGLLVMALAVWAWRSARVPRAAAHAGLAALALVVSEALIGAGLVRFELVAGNTSPARAWVMTAHLVNTFLLLAALALTAWWGGGAPPPRARRRRAEAGAAPPPALPEIAWLLAAGVAAILAMGASGAVAALGDTLFPAASFAEGFAQERAPGAHLLLRLRVYHPLLAAGGSLFLFAAAAAVARRRPAVAVERWARRVALLLVAQLVCGLVNLALAAPVALQLLHLVLADLTWIGWVLLAAAALGSGGEASRGAAGSGRRAIPAAAA